MGIDHDLRDEARSADQAQDPVPPERAQDHRGPEWHYDPTSKGYKLWDGRRYTALGRWEDGQWNVTPIVFSRVRVFDSPVFWAFALVPWIVVVLLLSGDRETISKPFHPIPESGVTYVDGSRACRDRGGPSGTDGHSDVVVALCELDLSDARVTGTETVTGRFLTGGWLSQVWSGESILTNEHGSWRGIAHRWFIRCQEEALCSSHGGLGAVIWGGYEYVEAHYLGEGAYDGLEFHYYSRRAADIPPDFRGWIAESSPVESG